MSDFCGPRGKSKASPNRDSTNDWEQLTRCQFLLGADVPRVTRLFVVAVAVSAAFDADVVLAHGARPRTVRVVLALDAGVLIRADGAVSAVVVARAPDAHAVVEAGCVLAAVGVNGASTAGVGHGVAHLAVGAVAVGQALNANELVGGGQALVVVDAVAVRFALNATEADGAEVVAHPVGALHHGVQTVAPIAAIVAPQIALSVSPREAGATLGLAKPGRALTGSGANRSIAQ